LLIEITQFFTVSNVLVSPLIKNCITRLKEIDEQLHHFVNLRVPYSSILIIYDVDKVNITDISKDEDISLKIKLIDFGFYKFLSESNEKDQSISQAIKNLVNTLEILISSYK
jgi:hypothetical protein